jgi:DNA-directed RNA polymerase specialized sigma24 family protein
VPAVTPGAAESARSVTELFAEHHLGLVRLALLMVGDLATAEDVVQDAFEQLHRRWRSLPRHRHPSPPPCLPIA